MKKILDRIPRPTGAIPARAQVWLLGCLAAAIAVALVSFPGGPDPAAAPSAEFPDTPPAASGAGVGSVDIAARRMREEAARNAERRLREELGEPEPRPDGLPHAPMPAPGAAASSPGPQHVSAEDEIEREERLRRYRSLRTQWH